MVRTQTRIMAGVDILLTTDNRLESLIMTLSGVAAQDTTGLRLIVSDQSDTPAFYSRVVQALLRVIEGRGGVVEWHYRVPPAGLAEQREFLLQASSAPAVLCLDDDILMEPWVVSTLLTVLQEKDCAFVGAFPVSLSFRDDPRPQQQYEYLDQAVQPDEIEPGSDVWEWRQGHQAVNPYHVSRKIAPGEFRLYKIAWVASCVLYDRNRLLKVGGFSFWPSLPRYHSAEEVVVQNMLMRLWGGCSINPSGTYYSEIPSLSVDGRGAVDGHALYLLPEMVAQYPKPMVIPFTGQSGRKKSES